MSSIRKLKRKFFRRQWFSPAYVIDGHQYPMERHGLRYDDIRARTGVRRSHVGQMELLEVPYDEMTEWRKSCKKKDQISQVELNGEIRQLRRRLKTVRFKLQPHVKTIFHLHDSFRQTASKQNILHRRVRAKSQQTELSETLFPTTVITS